MNLRVGILGAAKISRTAIIRPAQRVHGVEVRAIAARDRTRAAEYAHRNTIPVVHQSYEDLLNDPEIDAVYIPLPASLHGRWTLASIAAKKHVLSEKPFTANAEEAESVASASRRSGLVVMEAHHTAFHPFTARLREIVQSGVLGEIQSARARFNTVIPPGKDIRWNYRLGGGSLMDLGVYPVRMLHDLFGDATVVSAESRHTDQIDRHTSAVLDLNGVRATIECGMWSSRFPGTGLDITGSQGRMRVRSPYHPNAAGRLTVKASGRVIRERADRTSTYDYQLASFRDAIAAGDADSAYVDAAVRTMRTIDSIYTAAGVKPREPFGLAP